MKEKIVLLPAALALAACATIMEGTGQSIAISTNAARCPMQDHAPRRPARRDS